MITCMSDDYWKTPPFDHAGYAPWLRDRSSLTQRIRQRCEEEDREPATLRVSLYARDEDVRHPGSERVDYLGRLASLGLAILGNDAVAALRRTILRQLVADVGETCNLAMLWKGEVVYLDRVEADWALRFDTLTAVMVFVVTVVSCAVHFYSIGYMHHDPSVPRFMSYLSLFTFFMLMLVSANNLLQLFFGWEGVGLASYLLIGFWYDRPSAIYANLKAFLVNRVGDFGFLLGIALVLMVFGTLDYAAVFANAAGHAKDIAPSTRIPKDSCAVCKPSQCIVPTPAMSAYDIMPKR